MKKIFLAIALIGLFAVSQVKAQESFFAIEYSVGFGMGDTKDFVNTVSWRGMAFEYRYFVQPAVGVGFETGYNLFYEKKPYATYTQGTKSLSGTQFRYLHMVPILGTLNYHFKPDTSTDPYVGLGLGTLYANRDVDMGMYSLNQDAWQFALRPEIGVLISTYNADFIVAAKYMMGFKTSNMDANNYFTINLGIAF